MRRRPTTEGEAAGDQAGTSVDAGAGMAAMVLGPGTGRHGASEADVRWSGAALDELGSAISRAGDADDDGQDDAWFAAPRADWSGYTNNGAIELLSGAVVP